MRKIRIVILSILPTLLVHLVVNAQQPQGFSNDIDSQQLNQFKSNVSGGKNHTAVVLTMKIPSFALASYLAADDLPTDYKKPSIPKSYVMPQDRTCLVAGMGILPDDANSIEDAFMVMACSDEQSNAINLIVDKLAGTGEMSKGQPDDLVKSFCKATCVYNPKGYYEFDAKIGATALKKIARYINTKNTQKVKAIEQYAQRLDTFFESTNTSNDLFKPNMKIYYSVYFSSDYSDNAPLDTSYLNFYKSFINSVDFTQIKMSNTRDSHCDLVLNFSPRRVIVDVESVPGTGCKVKNFKEINVKEYEELLNFKYTSAKD